MTKIKTNLLDQINKLYPKISIVRGDVFYWSPSDQIVYFSELNNEVDNWSLLHEVGHAISEHKNFKSDFDLLLIEVEAWEQAKKISKDLSISIDEDHIQDCLDTYRDWLYLRSTCPTCTNTSLQLNSRTYSCINCNQSWKVTQSRQKRCYRKKIPTKTQ